jgi:hypothetical protein
LGLVALMLLPTSAIAPAGPGRLPHRAAQPFAAPPDRAASAVATIGPSVGLSATGTSTPATAPVAQRTVPAASLPPHPSNVNPLQFRTREPAPMGIADFGVTGTSPNASAYEYSSSSFQGQAVVRSLSVTISGSSSKVTAFELNAVVVLDRNGTDYSYWIQNGLHLDASSDEYTIGGAYVWNFSSPGATLRAGELSGDSGSVLSGDTYYFIPGCGPSYPGQCTTLSLPATLTGRIVTSTSAGLPYVAYQYNLGSGWVTYDNVSFAHMANATDSGFRVDGFASTPYAADLYYDAEWVWVGAGGGSASTDQGSNITMTLSSWNGHNFQAVPSAWNFGSNTGESSSNVTDVPTNSLGAHLSSGAGTLGVLYNLTGVGFLNVTVPTRGVATTLVDGKAIAFQGGWANLTLPVGTHTVDLQNFTNASAAVAIDAGATTFLNLSGAGEVTINETGLPPGTPWGVDVNGTATSTHGKFLNLNLENGSYSLTYPAVPGFYQVGSSPSTLVVPGTTNISLRFAAFTYDVSVTESGLPRSTPWWIDANGTRVEGNGSSLEVMAPNGSTPYEVGSRYEFVATPAEGSILVTAGVPLPVPVAFSYRPTFVAGTVDPAGANLSVNGTVEALAGGSFNISVIPGSYDLVASASGYATDRLTVTATPGNVTWENVTLTANQSQSPGPGPISSAGSGISALDAALLVAAVAVAAVIVVFLLVRRRP